MVKRYDYVVRSGLGTFAVDMEQTENGEYVTHDDYECLQMELAGSQDRGRLLFDAKNHWADKARALAERCERMEAALRMARDELDGLTLSLGYAFTHLPKIDAVLGGWGKDG